MERLTYKTNGKYLNTTAEQAPPYSIDCDIDTAITKLAEYEDLEEQGKLTIMAFEICVVSECNHCNHVERRIEEMWIRPELLNHDGFYKTREEAEAALKEMERGKGE